MARSRRIPLTMRAAAIDRFGGPAAISIHKLPVPVLDPDEVLIALNTAGVGGWDARFREGSSESEHQRFPFVPGTDGSGVIAAVGSRVRRFKAGDRVYAYSYDNPKGGFYAEYVAVPSTNVSPMPAGLDFREAGAIGTTGLTALQGVEALDLQRGETVIVHGASGGVGSLALQFAKNRDAHVLATGSGKDGVALVRRLGADLAVDGKRGDIEAAARALAPNGIDAVLAFAGGPALTRCLDSLRRGGRVAYPNGVEPAPRKRRGIKMTVYDGEPGPRQFERLNRAVGQPSFEVPIAKTYTLANASRAHERLARGHIPGKIVLRIR